MMYDVVGLGNSVLNGMPEPSERDVTTQALNQKRESQPVSRLFTLPMQRSMPSAQSPSSQLQRMGYHRNRSLFVQAMCGRNDDDDAASANDTAYMNDLEL